MQTLIPFEFISASLNSSENETSHRCAIQCQKYKKVKEIVKVNLETVANYFTSLINKAYSKLMLTDGEVTPIQYDPNGPLELPKWADENKIKM